MAGEREHHCHTCRACPDLFLQGAGWNGAKAELAALELLLLVPRPKNAAVAEPGSPRTGMTVEAVRPNPGVPWPGPLASQTGDPGGQHSELHVEEPRVARRFSATVRIPL